MREKFLRFFRKVFLASSVVAKLIASLLPVILMEIQLKRLRTDAEIRQFIVELVKDKVTEKYPGYEFLIDTVVDALVEAVRARIRKHSVN